MPIGNLPIGFLNLTGLYLKMTKSLDWSRSQQNNVVVNFEIWFEFEHKVELYEMPRSGEFRNSLLILIIFQKI